MACQGKGYELWWVAAARLPINRITIGEQTSCRSMHTEPCLWLRITWPVVCNELLSQDLLWQGCLRSSASQFVAPAVKWCNSTVCCCTTCTSGLTPTVACSPPWHALGPYQARAHSVSLRIETVLLTHLPNTHIATECAPVCRSVCLVVPVGCWGRQWPGLTGRYGHQQGWSGRWSSQQTQYQRHHGLQGAAPKGIQEWHSINYW